MKVAVIGLGSIAQKAYLPTITTRAGLDPHLMTRSHDRLAALADAYRVPGDRRFTDLDALLDRPLDAAFVHVPTDQHRAVVGRLLEAGIPTYVDKPLANDLEGSQALVEQAQATGTPLMVGFNRRHVPAYVEVLDRPRDLIIMRKSVDDGPGEVRDLVFDDFIHVLDTLRFLAPAPVETTYVSGATEGRTLQHVTVTLTGPGYTALGIMHRRGGVKEEHLEVSGSGRKREVHQLVEITEYAGIRTRRPVDGWAPVARQRGIEQICTAFLDAVRTGEFPDLQDALETHRLCEEVVARLS